jgi:hypothetical protein
MFQPKEEACRVRIASSGCRVRRGLGSVARLYIKSRVHVIFWVTRHDTKLPHDFLERGADREIYSLVNHGYFDSSRIGKQADSIGVN